MMKRIVLSVCAAVAAAVVAWAHENLLPNPGFDDGVLDNGFNSSGAASFSCVGGHWTGVRAGVTKRNSSGYLQAADPASGTCAAYLVAESANAVISNTFVAVAGTYEFSCKYIRRGNWGNWTIKFSMFADGKQVGSTVSASDHATWRTMSGTVHLDAGQHVFSVVGTKGSSNAMGAIDDVCVKLVTPDEESGFLYVTSEPSAVVVSDEPKCAMHAFADGESRTFTTDTPINVDPVGLVKFVAKRYRIDEWDAGSETWTEGTPVEALTYTHVQSGVTVKRLVWIYEKETNPAVTHVWTGGVDNRFEESGNWETLAGEPVAAAPGADSFVYIPAAEAAGAANSVIVAEPFAISNLVVGAYRGEAGSASLSMNHLGTNIVSGCMSVGLCGKLTHEPHGSGVQVAQHKLNLKVLGNMWLESGGEINVDLKGYHAKCGPGLNSNVVSYGGVGMGSTSTAKLYGSISEPTDLGCGGEKENDNKHGGGAVYLDVAETLTVNGPIYSRSNEPTPGQGGSTGSGGSILIRCGTLAGVSTLSTDFAPPSVNGSSWTGPGGRIAVHQRTATDWSSFKGTMTSLGSSSATCPGGPGTVFRKLPGQQYGDLTVQGRDKDGGWCAITTNVVDHDRPFDSVTLKNKARLRLAKDVTLKVASNLDVSGGTLVGADPSATLEFVGEGDCTCAFSSTFDVKKVTCTVPGKRLRFNTDAAKKLVMPDDGLLTLRGSEEVPLELYPETDGAIWPLQLNPNTKIDVYAVAVTNSNAGYGKGVLAFDSVNLGGNNYWSFSKTIRPGQTNVWTGAKSTSWEDGENWDCGRAPVETDVVKIPEITAETVRYPEMGIGDKTVNELIVATGAAVQLSGAHVTVTNDLQVHGAVTMLRKATLAFSCDADFTGGSFSCNDARLRLIGDGDQTFNAAGVSLDYLIVAKPGGSVSFAGGFTANDWRVDAGAPLTLLFAPGASVTAHAMYLNGFTPGATNLALRGSVPGSAWSLRTDPLRQSVTGVRVRDCAAPSDAPVRADARTCADEGNNANWLFGSAVSRWAGGEGSFSDASRWIPGEVPGAGSHVAIVAGEGAPATVTLAAGEAVPLASLTVSGADGALAKFTANAPIAIAGDVEVLTNATLVLNSRDEFNTVDGDMRLYAGATLTHDGPQTTLTNRLRLQVAGDMTVDAGALVDVDGKGYTGQYDPFSKVGSNGGSGTHGGLGNNPHPKQCYDSVSMPVMYGSGGGNPNRNGGGAIYLEVTGTLTLNGSVTACSICETAGDSGAGGSILLVCGTLAGGGIVRADYATADFYNNYKPSWTGGGGRVSLIQRVATDWSAFTGKAWARGGKGSYPGAAGTVYRRCAGSPYGEVRVDNAHDSTDLTFGTYATLPSTDPDDKEVTRGFALTIGGGGKVSLTQNWTIYDLSFSNNKAKLVLGTNTLTLISREHKDGKGWPSGITITSNQAPNGVWGKIVWKKPGFAIIIR